MKISDLAALEGVVSAGEPPDEEITGAYTSDLLSDVIANAPEQSVLITMQAHKNTVACASLAGIRVLLLAHTASIPEDMAQAAQKEGVVLLASRQNQYQLTVQVARLLGEIE